MANDFYVYFNDRNYVTGISPNNDEFLKQKFKYTKVPYKEVEPYITGEKRQADAMVSVVEGSITKYFIVDRSETYLGYLYDINHGLVDISGRNDKYDVQVKYYTKREIFEINLSKKAKAELKNRKDKNTVPSELLFFITPKDEHMLWRASIKVNINQLRKSKKTIKVKYIIPDECSILTKKEFDNYSFTIVKEK